MTDQGPATPGTAARCEREHHLAEINRRLKEKGFEPGELQATLRGLRGDHLAPFTTDEMELGLLDAFANMGGATVWCGDGSSCAVQIIEHQLRLAGRMGDPQGSAAEPPSEAVPEIDHLKAENASLLESLREAEKERDEAYRSANAAAAEMANWRTMADRNTTALAAAEQRAEAAEKRIEQQDSAIADLNKFGVAKCAERDAAEKRAADLMVALRGLADGFDHVANCRECGEMSPESCGMDGGQAALDAREVARAALHDEERPQTMEVTHGKADRGSVGESAREVDGDQARSGGGVAQVGEGRGTDGALLGPERGGEGSGSRKRESDALSSGGRRLRDYDTALMEHWNGRRDSDDEERSARPAKLRSCKKHTDCLTADEVAPPEYALHSPPYVGWDGPGDEERSAPPDGGDGK